MVALLFAVIVLDALSVVALVMRHTLIQRAIGDPAAVTDDQLATSDTITGLAEILPFVAYMVAGAVYIVWFHRARVNAEAYGTVPQRLGRGWAIGAWFCPILNLWFPKQMTDDIWAASEPGPRTAGNGQQRRHPGLIWAWWLTWLGSIVLSRVSGTVGDKTLENLRDYADLAAVAAAVDLVAAVLAVLVVRRITEFQRRRELELTALPGMATPAPPAPLLP